MRHADDDVAEPAALWEEGRSTQIRTRPQAVRSDSLDRYASRLRMLH